MSAKTKGRTMYVPPVIIDELDDIMQEDRVESTLEASKLLCDYARVGREVNRLRRLDFSRAVRRIPTDDLLKVTPPKKSKKDGDPFWF